MRRKTTVFDGLTADNTVLSSLMVISPVIMCGDRLKNAIAVIYAFSAITFLSVLIGSFVPKKLPYAVKIIIYTVISSLVYIPVRIAAQQFFPEVIDRIGIYFMLLAVNSLIMVQTETKFYRMKWGRMFFSLIFYILGFDVVMLITSVCRELIAYGTVYDRVLDSDILISGAGTASGGFIFLGLFCGLYRKIRSALSHEDSGGAENVADN